MLQLGCCVTVSKVMKVPVQVEKMVCACLRDTSLSSEHVCSLGNLGGPGADVRCCMTRCLCCVCIGNLDTFALLVPVTCPSLLLVVVVVVVLIVIVVMVCWGCLSC